MCKSCAVRPDRYGMSNGWDQIKHYLETKITTEAYRNWIQKTDFELFDAGMLRVRVPDDATKQWLEQEYGEQIRNAICELALPVKEVQYSYGVPLASSNGTSLESSITFASPITQLNPKFSFQNFVVGSCNQFAHAAAQAVANSPSKSYNPLFIYGGVGMGKTHLMHAIGRALLQNYASMRIVYTSSERFMNEMIQCIKSDRMPVFHQHYRSADVLLIDDIQILAGKERTQEEFFHTFNELYDHQKQIVISSDSAPKNTPGLVERLRSRFEWGLMVDIQPPDLETKMAILDKKAEAEGIDLPEDVRIFIARNTKSNVRELEGALVKLIAYSSVTGHRINIAMAQQVLKHLSQGAERRVTVEAILRKVADEYSLQPAQLKEKTNARQIAVPRQIAMYLVKELTHASLPEIGRMFGGKHHTTVLHSVNKIEDLRQKDAELNKTLHKIIDSIH
jgi:chromosomal replication initiator protein